MSGLRRDAALVRASEIALRITASRELVIELGHGDLVLPSHALALLEAFESPRVVSEVIDELANRATSPARFVEQTSALHQLHASGVLVDPSARSALGEAAAFTKAEVHVQMLRDERRTKAFIEALEATVRPEDVVLDIGTGTGVLALAAARAGARHVYAIEASGFAALARAVVEDNGYAGRVTVIEGWSSGVELPERASVLVTETIGNDPFEERILPTIDDARRRLLLPDARILPRGLRVVATPVQLGAGLRDVLRFTPANLAAFRERYGFSFDALARGPAEISFAERLSSRDLCEVVALGRSTELVRVSFDAGAVPREVTGSAGLRVDRDGELDAVVVGFEAELSAGRTLSRSAELADPTSNWDLHARVLHTPRLVRAGDELSFRYAFERGRPRLAFG